MFLWLGCPKWVLTGGVLAAVLATLLLNPVWAEDRILVNPGGTPAVRWGDLPLVRAVELDIEGVYASRDLFHFRTVPEDGGQLLISDWGEEQHGRVSWKIAARGENEAFFTWESDIHGSAASAVASLEVLVDLLHFGNARYCFNMSDGTVLSGVLLNAALQTSLPEDVTCRSVAFELPDLLVEVYPISLQQGNHRAGQNAH